MLPFLFSTGSLWSYGLERCFDLAAQAGFDGLELMIDQRWDSRQPAYLAGLVQRYGLPVRAVHSPFSSAPGWPADNPGRIERSLRLAEALDADVVVHHLPDRVGRVWVQTESRFFPFPTPGRNPDSFYRRWLESEYAALQATTSVKLCIENMPAFQRFGRRWQLSTWNTPEEMLRFPHITLDTTHLGTWGLEPVAVLPRYEGRVSHVHLSNFDGREHRRPQDGRLALDRFLKALIAEGYQGAVSLELHPDALDAGAADERVLERMAGSLVWCRAALAPQETSAEHR